MPRAFDSEEPYTTEDLKRPGFDPFEAHREWILKKRQHPKKRSTAEQIARIKEAIKHPEPTQKKKRKASKRQQTAESVNLWKDALAAVRNKKGCDAENEEV